MPQTIQALRSLMIPAQLDRGCGGCWLCVDTSNACCLYYVEEWTSQSSLEREMRSTRFTRLLSVMEDAPQPPTLEFRFITQSRGLDYIEEVMKAIPLQVGLLPVLCAALLIFGGCKKKEQAAPPAPPQVEVAVVQQSNVPIYREWVGTLEGEVNATISAQVTGYLVERAYQEGSIVTNGQVLFQIDKGPFKATLAQAKAQLEEAKARKGKTELDVKRYIPLAASEAISKQELDNAIQADKAAAAQIESAQATVQQAELNLAFTTIRSPVDGIAGLAQAQLGNLVGPASGPLTTVTQTEPIRASFSVDQQLVTQMQERTLAEGKSLRAEHYQGPALELILATGSIYPLKGRVRFADNQIDVKTGTIRVIGEFPNPQQLLVPGMFTRVRALLETQTNAVLVPQRAVTDMQGRSLLAVVGADNKISIRPVVTGERMGSQWVIKGDVKPGDRVVAEGVQKVREGVVISPVPLKVDETAPQKADVSEKPK